MKKWFRFDWRLDLNHVLTAGALLIAAAALYYQAQATSIARRELNSKLVDIAEIAVAVRGETESRQKAELDSLQKRNADLEQANRLAQTELDAATSEERNTAKSQEIFARCLFAIAAMLSPEYSTDDSVKTRIAEVIMNTQAATVHQSEAIFANIEARESAVQKSHAALEEISRSNLSETEREMRRGKVTANLQADIAVANKHLEDVLADSNDQKRKLETMLSELPLKRAR
jgi:hypothetical protein